jgi:hypothetical protein
LLDWVLLALKAGFLILLFLFVWLVMRGAARDVVSRGRSAEPLGDALPEPAPSSRAAPVAPPARPFVVPAPAPQVERSVPPESAVGNAPEAAPEAAPRTGPFNEAAPLEPAAAEASVGAPLAAAAAAAPVPDSTPEERRARREARAKERTLDGERLDFSAVINPRLIVEESPVLEVGTRYPLDGWVMIGRSPASDIVLSDTFVSSTHARLVPRGQLYFVEDVGSTNGTFVDGREVAEAQLKPDSRLRIGETTFRYEE